MIIIAFGGGAAALDEEPVGLEISENHPAFPFLSDEASQGRRGSVVGERVRGGLGPRVSLRLGT